MLVLTRKRNQEIMVGDKIKITILELTGDTVKIGIHAPKDITILRSELYQAVKDSNVLATTTDVNTEELLKAFISK